MAQGAQSNLGIAGIGPATRIGGGGFGDVYRANQQDPPREVAIKVLRGTGESARRRFDLEQRALGRLSQQPGVVTIYETGLTDGGAPYLVTELLTGGTLQDALDADGPLSWQEATSLMAIVARAVHVAHQAGVLHKDLKPANVLLDDRRRPVVADLGIASFLDATDSHTLTAAMTPAYSSPESITGEPVGAAADVYSLGATLHALLSGTAPFVPTDRGLLGLIDDVVTKQPPDLRKAGVPGGVCDAVDRAMAKTPIDRQGSALEFARELEALFPADETIEAKPEPPQPVRNRGPWTRLWWVGAGVALIIALTLWGAAALRNDADSGSSAPPSSTLPVSSTQPGPAAGPRTVPVGSYRPLGSRSPADLHELFAAAGFVWARTESSLTALQPGDASVAARIDLDGDPGAVAATSDGLWVVVGSSSDCSDTRTVALVDTSTLELEAQVSIAGTCLASRDLPNQLMETPRGVLVWFSELRDEGPVLVASLIDPATRAAVSTWAVAGSGILHQSREDLRTAYLLDYDATLGTGLRTVDLLNGRTSARLALASSVRPEPESLTIVETSDALWIAGERSDGPSGYVVERLEPLTGTITDRIEVTAGEGPVSLLVAFDSLWVGSATLQRLDLPSRVVTEESEVGGPLTLAGEVIWITDVSTGSAVRFLPSELATDEPISVDGAAGPAISLAGQVWLAQSPGGAVLVVED